MNVAYIDFDRTLFDSSGWIQHLAKRMSDFFPFPPEIFLQARTWVREAQGGSNSQYSPALHADKLIEHGYDIDKKKFGDLFYELAEPVASFLFPDALPFLKQLGALGVHRIILTAGDPDFQSFKLGRSGVGAFIDDIMIVNGFTESKTGHLADKIHIGARVFFINDDAEENAGVGERFPEIKIIAIDRYRNDKMGTTHSLIEVLDILKASL